MSEIDEVALEEGADATWRKLAMLFDRHRIEAMTLIKSVAAGDAGANECAAFAALPPPLTSPIEAERDALAENVARWRDMRSAPTCGRHCILSIKEGSFFWSVQGAYQNGQWNCVYRDNVDPVAWMPNLPLPDDVVARETAAPTVGVAS